MNEVRTTGSWLIICLSVLALGALLWFSVVRQFNNGIEGAFSALINPSADRAEVLDNTGSSIVPVSKARTPVFSLDTSGANTEVHAELPKGDLGDSVWQALNARADIDTLKFEIEEYDASASTNAEWAANLPDLIAKLPEQTDNSDLHLLITSQESTVLGKIGSTEEKDQLTQLLLKLAPNAIVSSDSFKVTREELPVLSIEKNGSVLEIKGQLASEYKENNFASELKNITNSTELIDSLRYSSDISGNASELENIGAISALLAENGSRSVIEIKDQRYKMQLFGFSGEAQDELRSQVAALLGDVPFELAVGRVGSKELEIAAELRLPTETKNSEPMPKILAVNFAFNSYRLTPESEPALSALLERMWAIPELTLVIEGHTDSTGNPESNQLLSQQRADAVKSYLVESGISTSRLKALGFGDEKPISSNETSEGRFKNRRIEVREEHI